MAESMYKVDVINESVTLDAGDYRILYQAKGPGVLHGFLLSTNTDQMQIRLLVDNRIVFRDINTHILKDFNFYTKNTGAMYQNGNLFCTNGNDFDFNPPTPIPFNNSLIIEVKCDMEFGVYRQLFSIVRKD